MRGLGNRYEEEESTARCQRVINEDSGQPLLKSKLVNKTWRVDRPSWWRANSKVEPKKNNCSKRQFYGYQINLVQRADRRSDHPGKHRLSLAGGQTFTSSDKCTFKKASCCIWEWKPFMVLMKQEADLIISSAWDKLRKQADDTELGLGWIQYFNTVLNSNWTAGLDPARRLVWEKMRYGEHTDTQLCPAGTHPLPPDLSWKCHIWVNLRDSVTKDESKEKREQLRSGWSVTKLILITSDIKVLSCTRQRKSRRSLMRLACTHTFTLVCRAQYFGPLLKPTGKTLKKDQIQISYT